MKRLRILLLSLLLLGAPLLPVVVNTGCTTTQKTIAYKSLASVKETVDAAMKAYAHMVDAGQVSAGTEVKVRALHEKFRLSFKAAVQAAMMDYGTPAPSDVIETYTALLNAVKEILK